MLPVAKYYIEVTLGCIDVKLHGLENKIKAQDFNIRSNLLLAFFIGFNGILRLILRND